MRVFEIWVPALCLLTAACGGNSKHKASVAAEAACPKGAARIPAGTFEMGTLYEDYNREERPVHKVTLSKSYCMDITEVTAGAYEKCVKAGGCKRRLMAPGGAFPEEVAKPATHVTWQMADTYCRWIGGRLPTEAEWEFAARGTDGRMYPWGNEEPDPSRWNAWRYGGEENVVEVGLRPNGASPFGLQDMAGNVTEWVADVLGHYPEGPVTDPKNEIPRSSEPDLMQYVMRGASFTASDPKDARASIRKSYSPGESDATTGVRCAYD